jgi:N6-L-threonylcarbamoyladenine synthase
LLRERGTKGVRVEPMRILGIESSCDESAASVVEDGRRLLSNVIASQVEIHARFGGVVPEVASRQHLLQFLPVVAQAMEEAEVGWEELDAIAVTHGPGLAGALLVGVNLAKALALAKNIPFIGVNHLEGHLYANWIAAGQWDGEERSDPSFPLLALIASGGHTDLVLMSDYGSYRLLGRTRDDAAGEAFDKCARVLGLGFPGGPAIESIARETEARAHFTRPWLPGTHDFSFSGLKSAVLRTAQALGVNPLPEDKVAEIAAGFQEAVVEVLVGKAVAAARETHARAVLLAGGVAANSVLRAEMIRRSPVPVYCPRPVLCTDNGAMIAACGYYQARSGARSNLALEVRPGLPLA